MSPTRIAASTLIVACGALTPTARSQQVLFEYNGSSDIITGGASAGDWNGDGVGDFAVDAPGNDAVAPDAGAVFVVSGVNQSTLYSWYGAKTQDFFGDAIAMPDLNGDGRNEVLVTDPYSDYSGTDHGSAFLYAGASGTQLWRFDGTNGWLGGIGGPTNDLDADGVPDVFLAEFLAVHAVSGRSGSLLFTLPAPPGDGHSMGFYTDDLGDLDGDGFDDFMVTSPNDNSSTTQAGSATIFSGANQSVLVKLTGSKQYEHFGFMCARIGDVDGDHLRDYAVTSEYEDYNNRKYSSVAHVFSAATSAHLADIESPDSSKIILMPLVYGTGDASGDGVEDLVLNEFPIGSTWSPILFSSRTLTRLYGFEQIEDQGYVTAGAVDFNGDGIEDLLGNSPLQSPGRVRVYGGKELWLDLQPRSPTAGQLLTMSTREGPTGSLTVLVIVGVDGAPTFQLVGGLGTFDASGGRILSGQVPSGFSGHVLEFLAFADVGHVVASAVESVTFQ